MNQLRTDVLQPSSASGGAPITQPKGAGSRPLVAEYIAPAGQGLHGRRGSGGRDMCLTLEALPRHKAPDPTAKFFEFSPGASGLDG
jgi:hypothetical protein